MNKHRVVVTGLGVVASNGVGVEAFWQANVAGRSGISLIDVFDPQEFASKIGGQVRGFSPADYMPEETVNRVDRFVHFGLASSAQLIHTGPCHDACGSSRRQGRFLIWSCKSVSRFSGC